MYSIPGYNNRRRQRGRDEGQDDMSQILAMYQMFSPEQQAREQLIRAQAEQTQMETQFAQQTMDPRIAALERAAQHDALQQQQMQMQMDQAAAMGPEQLRALTLQNDYLARGGAHGAKDAQAELQQAMQMAQVGKAPQDEAYRFAQAITDPAQRAQIYKANPLAQVTPKEYDDIMKQIGPFGPGKDTFKSTEPLPNPVARGRLMTEFSAKVPGLDTMPWSEDQKNALNIYKTYMTMPKEWDTDPYWLTQAQAAKSIEDLQRLKLKWEAFTSPGFTSPDEAMANLYGGF